MRPLPSYPSMAMLLLVTWGLVSFAIPAERAGYGNEIQPLLAEHCYACHGPDEKTRKAGLRFDRREPAVGALKSGKRAIVPGDPAGSELVRRLFSSDPDEMMPPPDYKKRPSEEAKATLRQWVEDGAVYEQHWAFEPVRKPDPPDVRNAAWPRNAIDRFVLARLEKAGMEPSPEAGIETLVRRLSLDLRGLPPSVAELAQLTGERGGEASHQKAIDRMLSSVHYGERMAQDWLDLARYGDTNGYHNDSDRSMWLYRDYVIDSFNDNKPYDQFIIENMAGDLLPEPSEVAKIASGFNRCVTFNEEGGADPDEFYVTYAVDRANTTGQVFLGLTVGCAQCHDHKYDPISQKEFYQLYAFFNSVEGEVGAGGRSGYHNKPLPPLLEVQTAEQKAQLAKLEEQVALAEGKLEAARDRPEFRDPEGRLAPVLREWVATLTSGEAVARSLEVTRGLQLHLDAGNVDLQSAAVKTWRDGSGKGRNAEATGRPDWLPKAINGQPAIRLDGKTEYLRTPGGGEWLDGDFTMVAVLCFHDMSGHQMAIMWGDEANGKRRALWKTDNNRLSFNGYHADVVGAAELKLNAPAIAVITQKGEHHATTFHLNGAERGGGAVKLEAYENTAITIGANNAGKETTAADFGEVLIYDRALDEGELRSVGKWLGAKFGIALHDRLAPSDILAIAAKAEVDRTLADRERLLEHFITQVHKESADLLSSLQHELADLKGQRDRARKGAATTMVMVEMKERKPAHVLMRGDFQQPGERVQPDVPAIFPRLPDDQPRNRLGLAHWLTDAKHPLVARVVVNRIWKQLFGTGLVETLGDFGTQGERPSHPELLDWLAADFVEHGWDVKRLQRQILESATYRQSSAFGADYHEIDPGNRLLSRAPRFRLSAEEVRDTALAVSGLLNAKVGGASVMPPQPSGYLSSIGKKWNVSKGSDRHRRGLYTFWRRTMLYPTFQIFDAPSREFCAVNRPRTNTPLQALVTLNDPAFVEAARAFAARILADGGTDDDARIAFAFKAATARGPEPRERALLREALDEQRAEFGKHPEAARRLLTEGGAEGAEERAAWVVLANVILNLDETITRE